MLLQNIVTVGVALMATSAGAAPAKGKHGKALAASRKEFNGMESLSARQSLFAIPSSSKASLAKRDVSHSITEYFRRFTGAPAEEDEEDDEDDEDEDDDFEDGSKSEHYYQPIGRGDGAPALVAKRQNSKCGIKSTTTAPAKTTTTAARTSTTSPAAAAPTSGNVGKNAKGLVAGYWPEWSASVLPPESIPWSKFDIVYYAFGIPTSSGSITLDDTALLKRFVAAAHAGNTKAILSIGGWGQSGGFSNAVSSPTMRAKFIASVQNVLSTYNLDGIDFDWEYPGNVQGGTSNPADTGNFQQFLTDLRPKVGKAILSAAVPQQVWQGSSGNPVGSVARASAALDHIVIMNYDVWGSSSTPGPNAPLGNLCGNSTQPVASAAGGVKAWTSAGFAREKILLGVPFYGYLNSSNRKRLIQRDVANSTATAAEEEHIQLLQRRGVTLTSMDGTTGSGQINFNQLVSQGGLQWDSSSSSFVAAGGFTKYWDDCSDTPFLSNGNIVVTYDDTDSLYDKGDFATLSGIAGVAAWSIDGDSNGFSLTSSLIAGLNGS